MKKFEYEFNGTDNLKGKKTICAIINNIKTDDTFSTDLVANCLSDIDSKLPIGYEMDRMTTLCNYFNPATVDKHSIELENSQFIYFAPFETVQERFSEYVNALEKCNFKFTNALDRKYSK